MTNRRTPEQKAQIEQWIADVQKQVTDGLLTQSEGEKRIARILRETD